MKNTMTLTVNFEFLLKGTNEHGLNNFIYDQPTYNGAIDDYSAMLKWIGATYEHLLMAMQWAYDHDENVCYCNYSIK